MKRQIIYQIIYQGISLLVVILLAGCMPSVTKPINAEPPAQSAQKKVSGDVLARMGDRTITVSEFGEKFNTLPAERRQGATAEEQKEKALERLVEMTLFSLEARAQKIDVEESIEHTILDIVDSILSREYYSREILYKTTVTDDEIKNYYDSHCDEFRDPEMVKARHILIRVEPDAAREEWDMALRKAGDLKREIDNGADFAKLARGKSDDSSTKRKGGALRTGGAFGSGYLTRESMPEGFPDIVFSLNAGEISHPVKSPKGYHIIKVETKRPEKVQTLDQVKGTLKQKLTKQKHEKLFAQTIERLKEKYKVVLNTDLLNSVKIEKKKKKRKGE